MKSINREKKPNQFYVLLKHFVLRMFNNDILKYENQDRERVIVGLAILSIAGLYVTHKLLVGYLFTALSGAGVNTRRFCWWVLYRSWYGFPRSVLFYLVQRKGFHPFYIISLPCGLPGYMKK